MSFPPFDFQFPNIFSSSASSKQAEGNSTFEIVKYISEKEMYENNQNDEHDYQYLIKQRDFIHTINIGYIGNKYVKNLKDVGCYIIMINSQIEDGPNGIFCLARSDKSKSGNINAIVSSLGKYGDKLEVVWNPYENPCILLKHKFSEKQILNEDTKLRLGYNVKVILV